MRSLVILFGLISVSAYATIPSVGTVGSVNPQRPGWLADEAAVRNARWTTNMQILNAIPEDLENPKYDPTNGDTNDEFIPDAPDAEATLEAFDQAYWQQRQEDQIAGREESNPLESLIEGVSNLFSPAAGCYQLGCPVFAKIDRSTQTLTLYLNGVHSATWAVSTGVKGRSTPAMNQTISSRIYDKYSSRKFPGGDYKGLGNMPYAVFIRGGYAIHGTPAGNWSKLGKPASHGCIRLHPEHAKAFNRLARANGSGNVWVQVI
jgi:hypothetical protein